MPLLAVAAVVLWMLGRAAVNSRLDRDLLTRELGRQLGQPVTLKDYALAWDGHVRLDELTVGNVLKVRRADTVLPWGEVLRGQIQPRRLTLTEPELTLAAGGSAGSRPPFPIRFENGILRYADRPPLTGLNGEWTGSTLEVAHPEAGSWQLDGARVRVENLSLEWLTQWLGQPWPLQGRAAATLTLDDPWRAELELPYGNVTLRPEGSEVLVESPRLRYQERELQQVVVRLNPASRELTSLSAVTPLGKVTVLGHVSAEKADARVEFAWAGLSGTIQGPWSELQLTGHARLAGMLLRATLKRKGSQWVGRVTGPRGLDVDFAQGRISGTFRRGIPLKGTWSGTKVHVEASGVPVLEGKASAVVDGDLLAQTATVSARLPRWQVGGFPGPAARLEAALANGTWRPTALELADVKPPVVINGTLNPLKVEVALKGQTVKVRQVRATAFGDLRLDGTKVQARLELKPLKVGNVTVDLARLDVTGPPWRGTVEVPALKLPGVNGTLAARAELPDRLTFSSEELAWQGRKFRLAGSVANGTQVKLTQPLALQGRLKGKTVALSGPVKGLSLQSLSAAATGNVSGQVALKAGLDGKGSGSFTGVVTKLHVSELEEAEARVQAQVTLGKPVQLHVSLPRPRWARKAVPPLQASLLLGTGNGTVQNLTVGCEPPQVARGKFVTEPPSLTLTSALKSAPLNLLPVPVGGTATGNLTASGNATAQRLQFAGTAAELSGWGHQLGHGNLSVNATRPPLAFTARGSGFQAERLSFLGERYPGLKGTLRFAATEKEAEVHLESMAQGNQFLPYVSAWVTPAGAVRKLVVGTLPTLELAGTLTPFQLSGQLSGQSLSELIRLAGGKPNPDIGMRLTGPVTLAGSQLTFQGTVQELTYKKGQLGSGRLTLNTHPTLDGRLVLDRPLSLADVAAVGLAPPALQNPLLSILGGTVLANVQVTGVRLGGSLEAPSLTPEISGR